MVTRGGKEGQHGDQRREGGGNMVTTGNINSHTFSMEVIREYIEECTNRNNCQFPLTAHFWI